ARASWERSRRTRRAEARAKAAGSSFLLVAQKLLHVPDHVLARIGGDLHDLRVHADRVLGADFDAVAAVDALAEIDVEALGALLDHDVGAFLGLDLDAARRTDRLAHHAGDAARRAVVAL